MSAIEIDRERLRADIEETATYGALPADDPGRGRTVRTGTTADEGARDHLVSRLRDAGLSVEVDGVGNVIGRWEPASVEHDRPVVAGSHLDSVPEGGIFDGPLGVYAALEAVRAIQESDREPDRPLAVVSFTEEEGTRYPPLLGSAVATGRRDVADAQAAEDDDGVPLADALASIGYLGEGRLDASSWDAWFEVHVEQGRRLEEADVPVGVVTDVTGISQLEVTLEGEANHAGTTPMADRRDALAGAADLIGSVEDVTTDLLSASETVVGTVGRVSVSPNGTNVIPGRVDLGVDVRDVERWTMDEVHHHVREAAARIAEDRGLEASVSTLVDVDPTPLAAEAIDALDGAAESVGVETLRLHSGAGHDTMHVADVTTAGMLFAPSVEGRSHSPHEWTEWADCATATAVLARAMADRTCPP